MHDEDAAIVHLTITVCFLPQQLITHVGSDYPESHSESLLWHATVPVIIALPRRWAGKQKELT